MSLINDALKKAQKAHSVDMPPPPMGHSHAPSHSVGKGQLVKIFFAAVMILGIFGSAATFMIVGLISDTEQEPDAGQASIAAASDVAPPAPVRSASTQDVIPVNEPKPAQPLPLPKANTAPASIEPIAQSAPPLPEPAPAPPQPKEIPKAPLRGFALVRETVAKGSANASIVDSVVESANKAPPPAAPKPVPVAAAGPQPPPAQAQISSTPIPASQPAIVTPKPVARPRPQPSAPPAASIKNPAILEYIEKMVIQGVRLSGTNSKVLMDNKVYRLNSFVNRDLKLRIISINKERIIFADYAGVQYAKFY